MAEKKNQHSVLADFCARDWQEAIALSDEQEV